MVKNMRCLIAAFLGFVLPFVFCASIWAQDEAALAKPDVDAGPPATREDAQEAVLRLVKAAEWREVSAIQKELAAMGDVAVAPISREAKDNDDCKIRLRCYELLTRHFGAAAEETIASDGLNDSSQEVRYLCAWHVGDLKIYGAHRSLRRLMDDPQQPEHVRQAATKSLAELGEPDVIGRLIDMMARDRYMARYMGNLGVKSLTGKDLNDFNGYDYSEGAFVSGGVEATMINVEPAAYHKTVADRHLAIAEFCTWLENERPEIFKHLYAPW